MAPRDAHQADRSVILRVFSRFFRGRFSSSLVFSTDQRAPFNLGLAYKKLDPPQVGISSFSAIFNRKCRNCPFFVHFNVRNEGKNQTPEALHFFRCIAIFRFFSPLFALLSPLFFSLIFSPLLRCAFSPFFSHIFPFFALFFADACLVFADPCSVFHRAALKIKPGDAKVPTPRACVHNLNGTLNGLNYVYVLLGVGTDGHRGDL